MRVLGFALARVLLCSSYMPLMPPPLLRPAVWTPRRHVHAWLKAEQHPLAVVDEASVSSLGEIPDFKGPARLMKEAYKKSRLVPQPKISNTKKRATKHAARVIEVYASTISIALREMLREFRQTLRKLPPFQKELAELTLAALERDGGRSLHDVEQDFDLMRRAVVRTGKEATAEAVGASSAAEAKALMSSGVKRVQEVFEEESEALLTLIKTVGRLRRLPRPVDGEAVLVLVGMPNVGKSSLVSALSTCTPEINDYPFTTRQLKVGHVIGAAGRYQVMDTPGVLARAEEERNPMEGLTLAAVEHLPSAVVFVMDLSGTSGAQSAPQLQLRVREQVHARYPTRPWLDVCTKADLPLSDEIDPSDIPGGALKVSAKEETGIEELKQRMTALVGGDGERAIA